MYYTFFLKHIVNFEWDENKDEVNKEKHGVSFALAQLAFIDNKRIFLEDLEHGADESTIVWEESLTVY